ncbi:hypothetical protein BDV95DRAFT_596388 [Massariosphaeria phaeospora]|uniref:Uncharacterized protein n=1 Tax=Massariosphaeria phaeospora TaxID=100035 RepID=A0A7C8I2U4_9PLEO|nr:hypothetical protein BDV95DRAFT_596388 [Massariosphaeria phaeospora]
MNAKIIAKLTTLSPNTAIAVPFQKPLPLLPFSASFRTEFHLLPYATPPQGAANARTTLAMFPLNLLSQPVSITGLLSNSVQKTIHATDDLTRLHTHPTYSTYLHYINARTCDQTRQDKTSKKKEKTPENELHKDQPPARLSTTTSPTQHETNQLESRKDEKSKKLLQ